MKELEALVASLRGGITGKDAKQVVCFLVCPLHACFDIVIIGEMEHRRRSWKRMQS